MSNARKIFTKSDRELLHGILKGQAVGSQGVPIRPHLAKIQERLLKKKLHVEKTTLNQIIYWKTNNQPVWQTIYELVEEERPGLFNQLLNLQAEGVDA